MELLQKEKGKLVMTAIEKTEVLSDYFTSVLTSNGSSCTTQAPEYTGEVWEKKDLPTNRNSVKNALR